MSKPPRRARGRAVRAVPHPTTTGAPTSASPRPCRCRSRLLEPRTAARMATAWLFFFPRSLEVAMATRRLLPCFRRPPSNPVLPSPDLAPSTTDPVAARGEVHPELCRVRAADIRHARAGGGGLDAPSAPSRPWRIGATAAVWWPSFLTGEGRIQWASAQI